MFCFIYTSKKKIVFTILYCKCVNFVILVLCVSVFTYNNHKKTYRINKMLSILLEPSFWFKNVSRNGSQNCYPL